MIAVDAQGFFIRDFFHIAELSFYNQNFDAHYSFCVNLPYLRENERKTINFLSRYIHGLSPRQHGLSKDPREVLLEIALRENEVFVTNNEHLHTLLKGLGISVSRTDVTNKDLNTSIKETNFCHKHSFAGRCSKDKVKKLFFYLNNVSFIEQISKVE